MSDRKPIHWLVAVLAVAAIVAMLAYARNGAGIDDRIPDPEDAAEVTG